MRNNQSDPLSSLSKIQEHSLPSNASTWQTMPHRSLLQNTSPRVHFDFPDVSFLVWANVRQVFPPRANFTIRGQPQFHPFARELKNFNGRRNTTETNWNRPLILAAYGHGNFNRNNFVDSWPWLQPFSPHVVRVGVSECSGEASPSHILNDENPWKRGPEFDVAEPPNTMILVTVFKD